MHSFSSLVILGVLVLGGCASNPSPTNQERGDQACCDPDLEPGTNGLPFCFEGATCCADGAWACNEGDGSPTCAAQEVCEATCDPALEPGTNDLPTCFEGATCCGDGTWKCNEGDGSPTCDS